MTVTAPSKTQAVKQIKQMLVGCRIVSVEDLGAVQPTAQQLVDGRRRAADFKPIESIKREAKQKPNDTCACGSKKKYKRCCLRKPKGAPERKGVIREA